MLTYVANLSYIPLSAREVHRLALKSIAEIDTMRRERTEAALNEVEDEICTHLFGFVRHKRYASRQEAFERAPEVRAARAFAHGDRATCELLQKAAQHLLDDDKISGEQKIMYISLNDFRALT